MKNDLDRSRQLRQKAKELQARHGELRKKFEMLRACSEATRGQTSARRPQQRRQAVERNGEVGMVRPIRCLADLHRTPMQRLGLNHTVRGLKQPPRLSIYGV